MTESAWKDWHECAINEQGRKVLTHPTASKANEPGKEVTHMPFEHDYGDSTLKNNTRIESSRTEARSVACPNCGAEPMSKCIGARKLRESCHLERHFAFQVTK
jgi:predicted RNA-binding Zn-ribbon protein involved in translation (DUF1610 family)